MKNKVLGWIAGGLFAVAVVGVSLSSTAVANAAGTEPDAANNMKMQQGQSLRADKTKLQETQKQCGDTVVKSEAASKSGLIQSGKKDQEMQQSCDDMIKNADMQKMMQDMMTQPQMQTMMKQMMTNDPALKQMMKDMVNEEDQLPATTATALSENEHNAHHNS